MRMTGGFQRRCMLGAPMAAVVAACVCFCLSVGGVFAFADVGEASASGSACNNTKTTVFSYGDEASASSLAAQVLYADCSSEVVKATTDSSGSAQLNLSGKQIVNIASLPSVVKLDLSNNSIASLANASIPSSVKMLDLSQNPFTSFQDFDFPSKLSEMIAASGALTSLQNFSFPDTVSTLNFADNPVTHIAGVTFPTSLKVLVITSTVGLQEFEVRQTDAALFMVLDTFNSSATTGVTCSDSVALHRYVQNTLLCVLDDDVFESKYHGTQESSSNASGSGANTPAPVLNETVRQNRSKFLILSAVALVAAFAALMCALFVRSVHERRQRKKYAEVPNVLHPATPTLPRKSEHETQSTM